MFDSENDRLERINNAHLMLIGYLYKTIKEQDTEIAALKDQLRAKPVHGQELEAEIERLENEARDLRTEIGRLRNPEPTAEEIQEAKRSFRIGSEDHITKRDMDRAVDELITQFAPMSDAARFVGTDDLRCGSGAATDDTSLLREMDKAARGKFPPGDVNCHTDEERAMLDGMGPEYSDEPMPMSMAGLSKPTGTTASAEGIDKSAVRKVLAQGRIISPVRTAARRAMNQQERREEGRA